MSRLFVWMSLGFVAKKGQGYLLGFGQLSLHLYTYGGI
jgi:hypothetical protein